MSLVFGSGKQTAPVTFSEISGPDVVVFLDQNLWNAVNEQGDGQDSTTETSEAPTKVAVVVEPLNGPSSSKGSGLSKIMEWAVLDASITGASFPRKWVTEYPNLFSDPSLVSTSQSRVYQIGRVHPPVLSEVVLLAKTSSALQVARAEPERVKNSFCSSERFLRHGSSYPLDSSLVSNGDGPSDGVYDYEVIMTQPVLQGVADAALTSFIVTADASLDDASHNGEDTLPNGADSNAEDDNSDVSELDGIEIGEGFLASSVPPLSASTLSSAMGNNPAWDDEPPKSAALSETSSRDASSASEAGEDSKTSGITLSPRSLSSNPALPAQGHFAKGEDPEIFTYVSPADLGSLGLFSGDWVRIGAAQP
ncbi:hypothetical protein DL93DRAFT_1388148 [Clavulina sp. PMI_390]|nr:hypothetical protein DL93DRAFT_1388148 [Clavulina sp. PMI_390]